MSLAIHRLVEEHAARRGDHVAVVDGNRSLTYRELNQGANVIARRLIAGGLRRGCHVCVRMPRGTDLALVLLAVLKAGGSYTWSDPQRTETPDSAGISVALGPCGAAERYVNLDLTLVLHENVAASPNLPILTRGSDVACVLEDAEGRPVVLVPHATVTSLRTVIVPRQAPWCGEPGAFDLWLPLVKGATAVVEEPAASFAAA